MAKVKGIIQKTEEKLQEVEKLIEGHHDKARELSLEAEKLRLNSVNDFMVMGKSEQLEKAAKSHVEMAQQLVSNDKYVAMRDLEEQKEQVRRIKGSIEGVRQNKEQFEKEKEQLKKLFVEKSEQLDRDIENSLWQVEQFQLSLEELEGK